ncbi:nucleotidyltransferase domain-containing protein [Vibrio sp. CAU 1672]|uniref:nucleotidyltransferase domain-containing protein n=1 Tax=Vibrio sp. CAU 1672 TaxID=3032594 RepID=UPI0023DA99EB|nr:nucleotidyltransferase domain-containing protein [Vibrio sp. CAU 1672]MDF2154278.1 nucleotidyltransferase domain-containing protein [Vibrio sp. CAU 1672]
MSLAVIDPQAPFQPEYAPLIQDLLHCLKSGLGNKLHSLYVYGSVARKTATPGKSNIDLVVVTHSGFEDHKATLFNTIKWRVQKEYPHVNGVSIRCALVKEVANLDSIFTWGFMLKHCCVCLYGENLGECFGDYVPSWEIAKHWNMDVEDWLIVYRKKIAQAGGREQMVQAQQVIAKKLLRAAYSLIMYKDKRWFDDPLRCGEEFLQYHPEKATEIERLGILLSGRPIPKRSVIGLIDSFGQWLVKQYQKTEFRIG